jgi:hypothetical protein
MKNKIVFLSTAQSNTCWIIFVCYFFWVSINFCCFRSFSILFLTTVESEQRDMEIFNGKFENLIVETNKSSPKRFKNKNKTIYQF